MDASEAHAELRRRGYSPGQADLAVTRAAAPGGYQLSRHRVTVDMTVIPHEYRITPADDPLAAWRQHDRGLEDDVPAILRLITETAAHHDLSRDILRFLSLEDRADFAVDALVSLQCETKDADTTWRLFLEALARAAKQGGNLRQMAGEEAP